MGYELKLLVVQRLTGLSKDKIVLVGKDVYHAYNLDEKDKDKYYYYPDGDTKIYVSDEPMIESEDSLLLSLFNLHKLGSGKDFGIRTFIEADGQTCSVYDPFDGNKLVGLDSYGDYRKILTLEETIELLSSLGMDEFYAVRTALDYLRYLAETFKDDSIGCMFYGH